MNKEHSQISEQILKAAFAALTACVTDGISLDDYLDHETPQELRPAVASMLFEYFRNKNLIDSVVTSKCARKPKGRYQRLLALVLTQCFFQHGIRPESAVNVAVHFARSKYGKSASGFINGVLRGALAVPFSEYTKKFDEKPLLRFPKILQKRWQKDFSVDELRQLGQAMTMEAPFTFRQTGDIGIDELTAIKAEKLPEFDWAPEMHYFSTTASRELFKCELPATGKVYIQDPAASMAPCMVPLKGDEKVLDMCAAPGGKSLILAERLGKGGKLIASDRSAKRQELTRENFDCREFECDYDIIVSGAEMLELPKASFDVVLADVPCTNTGVFRHKSDALWRFSEDSLKSTKKLQRDILEKAVELTSPGGYIIYSTCSIEREENQAQVKSLIEENHNLNLEKERLLLPGKFHDGAYTALIRKAK